MKKEIIQCPICKELRTEEDCVFAKVKIERCDKKIIYCCENQLKKVKI